MEVVTFGHFFDMNSILLGRDDGTESDLALIESSRTVVSCTAIRSRSRGSDATQLDVNAPSL